MSDDLPELARALQGEEPATPPFAEAMGAARARRLRRTAVVSLAAAVVAGAALTLV